MTDTQAGTDFAIISRDMAEPLLDWLEVARAIEAGHALPRARLADTLLERECDSLLTRSALIDGLGLLVKAATVFPGNGEKGLPSVNGAVSLFSDTDGQLEALIDFHLLTRWKTAADSLLAALRLARPDSRSITILGAGSVARALIEAYRAGFPEAAITLWNRTPERAEALAGEYPGVQVMHDLEWAVRGADIVSAATMAQEPLIRGAWLHPGQHLDLIGAFRPDMREADDETLLRARIFVDSRATVLDHIGELRIPLAAGVIRRDAVIADFHDLPSGLFRRETAEEITLFKNGGGAHLDLMVARHVFTAWEKAQGRGASAAGQTPPSPPTPTEDR